VEFSILQVKTPPKCMEASIEPAECRSGPHFEVDLPPMEIEDLQA
jgi:hypothetical protein